jgi:hypothetical protein
METSKSTIALTIIGILVFVIGLFMAFPTYNRYQKIRNAHNEIAVNEMKISQTKQLVEVEKQKAEIEVAEANGIAQAQQIINATLTDRYLQHEAIKAQENMASSLNHTQIYIPVGTNGIPLVKTLNPNE